MTTTPIGPEVWLATIRTEGDRLAKMPRDHLDAPVPTLEAWTIERVVRHVGKIHRWVTGVLAADADTDTSQVAANVPSLPRGPESLVAYRQALNEMLASLEADDSDRPVASFAGAATVAFWIRRQAHELAVHRIDAADALAAAGGPDPDRLDLRVAADGVGEWVDVFAGSRRSVRNGASENLAGHTVRIVVTDTEGADTEGAETGQEVDAIVDDAIVRAGTGAWELSFEGDSGLPATDGSPSVTIAGPADALFLTLWRRRPLDTVTVTGESRLAAALRDSMRF